MTKDEFKQRVLTSVSVLIGQPITDDMRAQLRGIVIRELQIAYKAKHLPYAPFRQLVRITEGGHIFLVSVGSETLSDWIDDNWIE